MQQPDRKPMPDDGKDAHCGVSMKFNFTVGAVSIVLACVIGYLAWRFLG